MAATLTDAEKGVCTRIKELREKVGLKQYQLAIEIGISAGSLSDIEACKSAPKLSTVISVCRIFASLGYDAFYILTGQSDKASLKDSNTVMKIGIEEKLTYDECEALKYFRNLPFREQLIEIGELKAKSEIAEKNKNYEGNTKSSDLSEESYDELTADYDVG